MMADSVNDNANNIQYEHLRDDGWQLSIDSPFHHLTSMVEMLVLLHRHSQHVRAIPFYDRQEPGR
jgi:hypothetical protein